MSDGSASVQRGPTKHRRPAAEGRSPQSSEREEMDELDEDDVFVGRPHRP